MREDEIRIHDKEFVLFIRRENIAKRIFSLAKEIERDYRGKKIVLLGVLNGAVVFLADLAREIDLPLELGSLRATSYQGLTSSGDVMFSGLEKLDLKDKHVLLVEDIVDTGLTMLRLKEEVCKLEAASISVVTLLFKPESFEYKYPINYVGFEIPNKFVVGYGLDFDELGRNLPDLYQLNTPN
ncbi:hypoxanthine phosphoribosyltransferase [Algoriphagus namhaensis]